MGGITLTIKNHQHRKLPSLIVQEVRKKTHHTSSSDQLNKNIDYTVQQIISSLSANKSADESDQGIFIIY